MANADKVREALVDAETQAVDATLSLVRAFQEAGDFPEEVWLYLDKVAGMARDLQEAVVSAHRMVEGAMMIRSGE